MTGKPWPSWIFNLLVLFLYCVLAVLITWPLIINLTRFIIDSGDGLLITWYLNWSIAHPFDLNANIFYPIKNTLVFSDLMLPQAFLAAPFVKLFKEPLLAYNLNFMGGFALTAFSIYLLVFGLSKDKQAAFVAGVLAGFSSIHLNYMAHLQLFNLWPLILTIHFFLQNKFYPYVLFFIASVLTTALFFYFLLVFLGVYYFVFRKIFSVDKLIKFVIIPVLFCIPMLMPYYLVSKEWNYTRPITDAIHFSFQIPDLLNFGDSSRLTKVFGALPGFTPGWIGLGMFLLVVFGSHFTRPGLSRMWGIFLAVCFVLSLGPALHFVRDTVRVGPMPGIPLPYAIFYYLVPGWAGFRAASRWLIPAAIGLVIMLTTTKKITGKWVIILFCATLLEINFPFKYYSVPELPPEQEWLVNLKIKMPIIQFPIYYWDNPGFREETLREYYSTYHWTPMYNGYSGFSPQVWEEEVKWLQNNFPGEKSYQLLRERGIKMVIVPKDWRVNLPKIATFTETAIYRL